MSLLSLFYNFRAVGSQLHSILKTIDNNFEVALLMDCRVFESGACPLFRTITPSFLKSRIYPYIYFNSEGRVRGQWNPLQ